MFIFILFEMRVGLSNFEHALALSTSNAILGGVGFEILDVGLVENEGGYELFEMLVEILIGVFDVFEFAYDPVAHYKFQIYN